MSSVRDRVVGVVDYQAGNLQSIDNALAHLGARTIRVHSSADVPQCSHLILPGVGAFGFCVERLRRSGLTEVVERWALAERRPLLGICVGMQLLGDSSEESPEAPGLGWIGGAIQRLPAEGVRVPHVGWNTVEFEKACGEFGPGSSADFYFDHSYAFHGPRNGAVVGSCEHGTRFCAVVQRDNVVAAQFHPEKSQAAGLRFLRGFLA